MSSNTLGWQQRIILALINAFCKPSDSVEAKRKQCLLAAISLVLTFFDVLSALYMIPLGTFTTNYHTHLSFVVMAIVLVLLRKKRDGRLARFFLFPLLIIFNIFSLVTRGGYMCMPMSVMIGLLAPVLSIFMAETKTEVAIWSVLFGGTCVGVHVFYLLRLLPPLVITFDTIAWGNFFLCIYLSGVYFAIFWFLIHVYTVELEARRSMQKDLEIFMRLSHEIRTPVTVITGLAELMQDWALPLDQKTSVSDLASAARRLNNVVNDFLTISFENTSSDGGTRGIAKISFNLREAVDTVIGYHLPQAEKGGLNMYLDIAPEVPLDVIGPKAGLVCVLDHLVSNAVKYTPCGSIIVQVKVETVNSSVSPMIIDVHFTVQDTGVGLDTAQCADIFLPFMQSRDVDPTRHFDGMGLGLTIAERMVNRWGRSISAASRGPGRGSSFAFSIPLERRTSSRSQNPPSGQPVASPSPLATIVVTSPLHSQLHLPTFPALAESQTPPAPGTRPTENGILLLLDDDPLSSRNIADCCSRVGLTARALRYGAATDIDLFAEAVRAVMFVLPLGPASLVTTTQQTILEHLRRLHHPPVSLSLVARLPDCFVVAPLALHPWCRETLKIGPMRRPPPFGQLRNVLRGVVLGTRKSSISGSTSSHLAPAAMVGRTITNDAIGRGSSGTGSGSGSAGTNTPTNPHGRTPQRTRASLSIHTPPINSPMASSSSVVGVVRPEPTFHPPPDAAEVRRLVETSGSDSSPMMEAMVSPDNGGDFAEPRPSFSAILAPSASIFHPQHWHHHQAHQHQSPVVSAAATEESIRAAPEFPGRILCVDDSPVILRILTNFIRKSGFTGPIDMAENGPEALRLVHAVPAWSPYLLIFMDYHMPGGLTGAEVTTQLRQQGDTEMGSTLASIPIIGLTAAPNMRDVCLAAGMTDVIFKPFTAQTIEDILKTHL